MNRLSDTNIKSLAAHIYAELIWSKKRLFVYLRGKEVYFTQRNDSSEKLLITAHPRETEMEIYRKLVRRCDELVNGAHIRSSLEASLPVMRLSMDDD